MQDTMQEPQYQAFVVRTIVHPTSTEERIKMLEAELCERIQDQEDCEDVLDALATLQKSSELEMRSSRTFLGTFFELALGTAWIGLGATVISFVATVGCWGAPTHFCNDARIIPNALSQYFFEPQPKRPPIFPLNQ